MKHIPPAQPSADYLAWVTANPNAAWNELRDAKQGALYQRLRDDLENHQKGLCAFCEIDLIPSDREIEHWHPKADRTGTTNWAIEFSNFHAACVGGSSDRHPTVVRHTGDRYLEPIKDNQSCGARKGELVPEGRLLRPAEIPPSVSIFMVDSSGRIQVEACRCASAGVDVTLAHNTITDLGLGCPRLRRARSAHWTDITTHLNELVGRHTPREIAARYLRPDSNGDLPKFFSMLRSLFGHVAEEVLNPNLAHP